jgi:ATP-dependent Clp protease ATP-binding subunit ClpB
VVLLDEIEKAHADVFNTLLAVLDDGRLTDGQGRTVDFKNTVLIMTSNIRPAEGELRSALLEYFKPEFINRLDDIVEFAPLSREQLGEIVTLQLQLVIERLASRGIELQISEQAAELLGDLGYDPVYGARPLKRVVQKQLVDRLAIGLIDGTIREGETVAIDAQDGEIVMRGAQAPAASAAA